MKIASRARAVTTHPRVQYIPRRSSGYTEVVIILQMLLQFNCDEAGNKSFMQVNGMSLVDINPCDN